MDTTRAQAMIEKFLHEHPEELPWIDFEKGPGSTGDEPWMRLDSCKKFVRWMAEKGYSDSRRVAELIQSLEQWEAERQAHQAGICNPDLCAFCADR